MVTAALGIVAAGLAAKRRIMLVTWLIDRMAQLRLSPEVILKWWQAYQLTSSRRSTIFQTAILARSSA